jgi:hypothetical protein
MKAKYGWDGERKKYQRKAYQAAKAKCWKYENENAAYRKAFENTNIIISINEKSMSAIIESIEENEMKYYQWRKRREMAGRHHCLA